MSKRQKKKQQDRTLLITGIVVAVAVVAVVALVLSSSGGLPDTECGQLVRAVNEGGMTTTESGLQYKVLTQGDGPTPVETSNVTVNYRGCLTNGTEFDSSYSRGQPSTFVLNGVIDGWTEGVQLMPAGSSYLFYIPSELGYGAAGSGSRIPPNAPLIFEITLLGFQ
ncbi:MAG TPA: FKBP-type peptidyl-prolyl cis-trans isomerase [Oceanobacillus sp.]|nr:FKBP-type peptidyl-prolyl cis-trans isomerase [Oceanobacillus sp.]